MFSGDSKKPPVANQAAHLKLVTDLEIPPWAHAVASTLLRAVRERDPYTYGHCRRVARNARLLALSAGLTEEQALVIEYSSLFHDLGKIAIPDKILLKPGPLTPQEDAIMRLHPERSVEIIHPLRAIKLFNETAPVVMHHHERIDGAGYPNGLMGEQIPIGARIMAIADTFDAMTTNRPYRKALPHEVGYKELVTFSGRQFDARLVKIFNNAHPTWESFETEISEEFLAPQYKKVG